MGLFSLSSLFGFFKGKLLLLLVKTTQSKKNMPLFQVREEESLGEFRTSIVYYFLNEKRVEQLI